MESTLRQLPGSAPARRRRHVFPAIIAALCLSSPASTFARTMIQVVDVPGLYAAVNDPANAGALIALAPGVYALDPAHPNAGRLELQVDMALQGAPGNPERTVIDASALPAGSYSIPPISTGAIRVGRGSNAVEWLTVQGARNGASAITTDLVAPGPTRVRIAHVLARDNVRGLDVRNIGPASAGRVLEVDIVDNVFTGHVTGAGQGLRLINSDASGASILAALSGNRSYGNVAGCIAANINTVGARIAIQSFDDRFDGNGNGCVFLAGLSQPTAATLALGNTLTVEAHAGSFRDNNGSLPPAAPFPGGILAVGGQSAGAPNRASGNILDIELWGVTMGNNQGWDINAYGALTAAAQPAGIGNAVTIALHGVSKQATESPTASAPPEPAGTNTVDILR